MTKFTKCKLKQSGSGFISRIKKIFSKTNKKQELPPERRLLELYHLKIELNEKMFEILTEYRKKNLEEIEVNELTVSIDGQIKNINDEIKIYEDKKKLEKKNITKKKSNSSKILDKLFGKLCDNKAKKIKDGVNTKSGIAYRACNFIFPHKFIDNSNIVNSYYVSHQNTNGRISFKKINNSRTKKELSFNERQKLFKEASSFRKLYPQNFERIQSIFSDDRDKMEVINALEEQNDYEKILKLYSVLRFNRPKVVELKRLPRNNFEKEIKKIMNNE
jgi:hypothetical protein